MLKDVLLHDTGNKYRDSVIPTMKERLNAFLFWRSENDCVGQNKREIADSFNLDDFTEHELLTDVRRPGLFSIQKIDTKFIENLEICQSNLVVNEKEASETKANLSSLEREIKLKEDTIKQQDTAIQQKDERIKTKDEEIYKSRLDLMLSR